MTLAEYEEILTDLVVRKKITIEEAQQLRRMFVNGEFDDEDLPLTIAQATEKDEEAILLPFALGTATQRSALKNRERERNANMSIFDGNVSRLAERVAGENDYGVRLWHSDTMNILASAMLSNWLSGNGTDSEPNNDEEITRQLSFLYRFAGETHARGALGNPFSAEYMVNRALHYGGAVWASWFRGNESFGYGGNAMSEYRPRDDGRTCDPCRRAAGVYPLNSGPMPGDVCLGGGRCRCERVVIYV